jgi:Rieske Fe-S protein
MTLNSSISRRTLLAAGAAGAGATALAACSSGRGPTDGGAAKNQSGLVLAKLVDVPVGRAVAVQLPDGSPAVVARPTPSTATCFSAICTHQGCTVAPQGDKLTCPCHGSKFNALTGAVLTGPASTPLHRVGVKVAGGKVVTI